MGGAERARPGTRRMLSGIRQAAACMTRRLAYPPAPLQGPPPGLLRPRSGQTARDAFGAGSGTDPGRPLPARHVRHRPGPVTRPSPAFSGWQETTPTRWLAFHRLPRDLPLWAGPASNRCRQRNPDGLRLPKPRRATSARPAPGIPSRLARNVRDPSGSGSASEYGMGVEGVEKVGWGQSLLTILNNPFAKHTKKSGKHTSTTNFQ
jgi:hypothetical protein